MTEICFPEFELTLFLNASHSAGFVSKNTKIDTIYINLFCEAYRLMKKEDIIDNIEEFIDMTHTHELIHIIDRNIPEKYVMKLGNIIFNNLMKIKKEEKQKDALRLMEESQIWEKL